MTVCSISVEEKDKSAGDTGPTAAAQSENSTTESTLKNAAAEKLPDAADKSGGSDGKTEQPQDNGNEASVKSSEEPSGSSAMTTVTATTTTATTTSTTAAAENETENKTTDSTDSAPKAEEGAKEVEGEKEGGSGEGHIPGIMEQEFPPATETEAAGTEKKEDEEKKEEKEKEQGEEGSKKEEPAAVAAGGAGDEKPGTPKQDKELEEDAPETPPVSSSVCSIVHI